MPVKRKNGTSNRARNMPVNKANPRAVKLTACFAVLSGRGNWGKFLRYFASNPQLGEIPQ
jgi:hypothetical protein